MLADDETWARQVAENLIDCAPDVWVANLGNGGVNIRHHVLQMQEVLDYMLRFDTFVVLSGLNDFLYDFRIHHALETGEGWWRRQAFTYVAGDEGGIASLALIRRIWAGLGQRTGPLVSDFGHHQEVLRTAYRQVGVDQCWR